MMNKQTIYLLCAAVLLTSFFTACSTADTAQTPTEQITQDADDRDDLQEGIDIMDESQAEAAYAVILDRYRYILQLGGDVDVAAQQLVDDLKGDAYINDEQQLRALYYSIEEPLRGNSNFGYAIRDINGDGISELFILSEDDGADDYTINAFYTLRNDNTVLVGAYWSRNRCALDADGTIYIDGSSGADDSVSASFSLNAKTGELQLIQTFDISYSHNGTTGGAGLIFTSLARKPADVTASTVEPQMETDAVYPFDSIVGYKGKVYSIYASPEIPNFIGISGSAKFTPLPETISTHLASEDEGMYVYDFTVYKDKIYYLAAEPGSDITRGAVYRCHLDGSQNEWLADANNFSTCMISDDWLYYNVETDGGDYPIFRIDLNNTTTRQDSNFPKNTDPGIAYENGFIYYFSDGTLCKKDIQTEEISDIMTLAAGSMNTYGDGSVVAVISNTVYYATLGDYSDNGNTYLFSVSIHGGDSELLASWFAS